VKKLTPLILLFTIIFIGATSCGDEDDKAEALEEENEALRAYLASGGNKSTVTNVTVTTTATAVVNMTKTVTNTATKSSSSATSTNSAARQ
jgi:sirohydrochlorin ferrochelatase